jgi:hypothetical protein
MSSLMLGRQLVAFDTGEAFDQADVGCIQKARPVPPEIAVVRRMRDLIEYSSIGFEISAC